jgi:hypothetical protein
MVEDAAVTAAQLEGLAELCLAPGRPWRCAPMACSLLGFAMRKALAPPPASQYPARPVIAAGAAAAECGGADLTIGIVARVSAAPHRTALHDAASGYRSEPH